MKKSVWLSAVAASAFAVGAFVVPAKAEQKNNAPAPAPHIASPAPVFNRAPTGFGGGAPAFNRAPGAAAPGFGAPSMFNRGPGGGGQAFGPNHNTSSNGSAYGHPVGGAYQHGGSYGPGTHYGPGARPTNYSGDKFRPHSIGQTKQYGAHHILPGPHDVVTTDRGFHRSELLPRSDPARYRSAHLEMRHDVMRQRAIMSAHEHDFRVRDVRRFDRFELARWRAGFWHRDWYNGRWGWWYDVGGVWYPYAAPFYPFPLFVASLDVEAAGLVAETPPTVLVAPLRIPRAAYYCASVSSYFPTVAVCPGGWTTIPSE